MRLPASFMPSQPFLRPRRMPPLPALRDLGAAARLVLPTLALVAWGASWQPLSFVDGLQLAFMAGLALALHVLVGRCAKGVAVQLSPLVRGESAIGGYARQVYGTPLPAVADVAALVLASGVLGGLGLRGQPGAMALGAALWLAAIALDLRRWERVAVSPNFVWFQRGLGRTTHQVAIENLRDVAVVHHTVRGASLRHLHRLGQPQPVCRLTLRMKNKRVVALPKTDGRADRAAVEHVARLIRDRLAPAAQPAATSCMPPADTSFAPPIVAQASAQDRDLRRALRRLRRQAACAAPTVPTPP